MTDGLISARIRPDVSPDAVIVVPGIMGSTLESESGVLWGGHRLRWYVKAWTSRGVTPLDELALTPDERAGHYGRIRATGVLRLPAWAPFLRGMEPYGDLLRGVREVVVHEDAVMPFAYDWRLPVAYNATLLESCIRQHLARWRAHPEYARFKRELPDSRPARAVVVAHSMGGLLARALPDGLDIRATVTLGTPFDGAAMAPLVMNTGRGAPVPLPRRRLRELAKTLPGLHDLLPTYRCLDDRVNDADPTRLTPELVADIGGDRDLAAASFVWHRETANRAFPGHHPVVGVEQPTDSVLTWSLGVLAGHQYTFEPTANGFARERNGVLVRKRRHGDGTVPRNSAQPRTGQAIALAQQHGSLARVKEAVDVVRDVLCEQDPEVPRLGDGDLGIELPDIVPEGVEAEVVIHGVAGPTDATVTVRDDEGIAIEHPQIHWADEAFRATLAAGREGVYQVVVAGGGGSVVAQRYMVAST